MAERPTPEVADLSEGPAPDGSGADGSGPPDLDIAGDELAAALAAVFEMSSEAPSDDDAPNWAPAPSPEWAPVVTHEVTATDKSPAEPAGDDDEWSWWDEDPADGEDRPPSSELDRSMVALQEAGFGGPLRSALGELGRIIPDPAVETAAAGERTEIPVAGPLLDEGETLVRSQGRRPVWLSVEGLRQTWLDHRREWGPGLIVAALTVVAFVVVLSAGGRDTTSSRVDTRSNSTAAPATTADVPTTLFEDVLPPEPPADPDAAAVDGAGDPSAPSVTPRRARPRPPTATSPPARQAGSRSGGAPAPAPAPAPAVAPPPSSPPPQTTPPTTASTPPTTASTPVTSVPRIDPCDRIENPDVRDACRRTGDG